MRWLVETKPDQFSDVGAECMGIHDSGALIFWDSEITNPTLVMASGTWVSVVPEPE